MGNCMSRLMELRWGHPLDLSSPISLCHIEDILQVNGKLPACYKRYVDDTVTMILHYESHVDARYKSSLITTMLQRAWRISSSWQHFTDECERLEIMLCKLKYPQHMVKAIIRRFTNSRITARNNIRNRPMMRTW